MSICSGPLLPCQNYSGLVGHHLYLHLYLTLYLSLYLCLYLHLYLWSAGGDNRSM